MFSVKFVLIVNVIVIVAGQNLTARNFNSDCGQVFTKKQFIIETPRYPSNYPLNYQCSYLIKGPTCPTYFTLQFLDFNLEDSLGCSKDRLEIDDKDALCGNRKDIKTYFSEKGTLILRFVSDHDGTGRGYRILITRSLCESNNTESTTKYVPEWYTTNKDVEYTTTTKKPNQDKDKRGCCQNSYSSKRFMLTSPNFPYSMSTEADCIYKIYKTNRNVCRLRIHVQFFWVGRTTSCAEGFFQIDGKFICGCKSDLKIISSFQDESLKILRFVSKGYERDSYSGFVMEIIQDECPKKYIPEELNFHNDQINRVAWSNESHRAMVEKLHLISENTEILEENKPKVVRHVYFFGDSDPNLVPRDREETVYVDTTSMSTSFVQNVYNYNYCLNWNKQQFATLSLRNLPQCKVNEGNVVNKKCHELNYVQGYFKSPGYPYYYPGNLNICYRFKKLPGYCSIRVHMEDFSIENSVNCYKDYLLFENQLRYCGSSISNTISTLDLHNKQFEDMHFVTDAFYCNRGFYGTYTQIECQDMIYPINPTTPPTTPYPIPTPAVPCYRTIHEQMFTLEVYDVNDQICTFEIKKYAPSVCRIRLYLEKFDLICTAESLVVDGTMYCGHLSGQTININVMTQNPILVYKKNTRVNGLRLRIKGIQITDDCLYPEVPAERLLNKPKSLNLTKSDDSKFVFKFNKHFKNICGMITNTTKTRLPETFCDLLMRNEKNITECLPLAENSITVPLESQKIELHLGDTEEVEEIEFEEIDCDDIMN